MAEELVPYQPDDDLEVFQSAFLVPSDWKSCGPMIHISGGPGLQGGQPVAMALTSSAVSLCSQQGPQVSVPLGSIREVKVEDLTGMSLPVNTPSGVMDMVPQRAKGISISYVISPMGTIGRLVTFALFPNAAHEWEHEIMTAIHQNASEMGKSGGVSRR
jgi:hypothetical protein